MEIPTVIDSGAQWISPIEPPGSQALVPNAENMPMDKPPMDKPLPQGGPDRNQTDRPDDHPLELDGELDFGMLLR